MKKKTNRKKKATLEQLVQAAHDAGARVDVRLGPKLPARLPDDPEPVRLLLDESERTTRLGNDWLTTANPNQIAGELALRQGWALALAGAWLRCKLKGELLPESKTK